MDHIADIDARPAVLEDMVRQCKKMQMLRSSTVEVIYSEVMLANSLWLSHLLLHWNIWMDLSQVTDANFTT